MLLMATGPSVGSTDGKGGGLYRLGVSRENDLAQVVVDRPAGRDLVVVTEPGYPVPERGARFAGADVLALPLREADGFLPDLDAVPESV